MDRRIAMIIPNKTIADSARQVIRSLGYHYPICHASQENALQIANLLYEQGCRIIISVGITARYIMKNSSLLVIELQYSGLEFIDAIQEALKWSDKIAIIGANNLTYAAQRTLDSLDIHVPIFKLSLNEPVEQQAERVIAQGYEVIISGSPSVYTAQRLGKYGIEPDMDAKQIENTIEHARHILKLIDETEQRYQTINTLLNSTSESIIGCTNEDQIMFSNRAAQKLVGLEQKQLINRALTEVFQTQKLLRILDGNQDLTDYQTGWRKVVVHGLPIQVAEQTIGTVYTIREVAEIQQLESQIRKELLQKGHFAKKTFRDIIGQSAAIQKTIKIAEKYAAYNSTVLIMGETGTGKELFAQSIHNASPRRHEAFVAVNCATIPENLMESELFGYEKGAFTGARQEGKMGLFEMAHNGTIFLDEISELPLHMQSQLLRVLQEKEVRRVGGDKVIPIDVRVLASSNKSLRRLIEAGQFREDLYYRLSIMELYLPPLRERTEDIKPICELIIRKKNLEFGKVIQGMTPEFVAALQQMPWQGNVRQLYNLMERLLLLCEESLLSTDLLHEHSNEYRFNAERPIAAATPAPAVAPPQQPRFSSSLQEQEYRCIQEALAQTKGKKQAAAQLLGIAPSTLWRKLKRYENPPAP